MKYYANTNIEIFVNFCYYRARIYFAHNSFYVNISMLLIYRYNYFYEKFLYICDGLYIICINNLIIYK